MISARSYDTPAWLLCQPLLAEVLARSLSERWLMVLPGATTISLASSPSNAMLASYVFCSNADHAYPRMTLQARLW